MSYAHAGCDSGTKNSSVLVFLNRPDFRHVHSGGYRDRDAKPVIAEGSDYLRGAQAMNINITSLHSCVYVQTSGSIF